MPVSVTVDGDVFAAHTNYVALIVLAQGIGNGPSVDASSAVLDAAEQHLLTRRLTRPADHPHIAAWRAAFSAFGAKPSKYPCSAEALAARVRKGATLPTHRIANQRSRTRLFAGDSGCVRAFRTTV